MYVDAQNLYSNAQAVTSDAASTNIIDHGAVRDIGLGENLFIVVIVTTTTDDSGDDSTVTVTLETDDASNFPTATTGQTLGTFAANAAAGTMIIARIQPGALNERYSRLKYTMANGDLSAGAFTAFITHDIQKFVAYPDGFTIS